MPNSQRPSPLLPVPRYRSLSLRLSLSASESDAEFLSPRSSGIRASPTRRTRTGPAFKRYDEKDEGGVIESEEQDFILTPLGPNQPLLSSTMGRRGNLPKTRRQPGSASSLSVTHLLVKKTGKYIETTRRHTGLVLIITFGTTALVIAALAIFYPDVLDDALKQDTVSYTGSASFHSSKTTTTAVNFYPPEAKPVDELQTPVRVVDYSKYTSFPLTPLQYAEQCWTEQRTMMEHGGHGHGAYWDPPPGNIGAADVANHSDDPRICTSSVTYLLDGETAGLVGELSVLAQVADLARQQGKPFFVVDKFWNRGQWTDYFENVRREGEGPEPNCLPPPPTELVACPRLARHWVVTFRTAKFHLTHEFSEQFEDPREHSVQRLRPIYNSALTSFTHTIQPSKRLRQLIALARDELLPKPNPALGVDFRGGWMETPPAEYVSVHIRKGDMTPMSWKFVQQKNIPIDEYVSGLKRAIDSFALSATPASPLTVYVASDSAYAIDEFTAKTHNLVEQVNLATSRRSIGVRVASLATSTNAELSQLAFPSLKGYNHSEWRAGYKDLVNSDTGLWTKDEMWRMNAGMIVDMALLSGLWVDSEFESDGSIKPSAVVCGIKSTICTKMALGLGFDRAFAADRGQRWVEVDTQGTIEPVWEAFRLIW